MAAGSDSRNGCRDTPSVLSDWRNLGIWATGRRLSRSGATGEPGNKVRPFGGPDLGWESLNHAAGPLPEPGRECAITEDSDHCASQGLDVSRRHEKAVDLVPDHFGRAVVDVVRDERRADSHRLGED